MFFGRHSICNDIINAGDTNFAIVGPRRIGKTSLAHMINQQLRTERRRVPFKGSRELTPVAYVDCNLIPRLSDDDFFSFALDSMGLEARDKYYARTTILGRRVVHLSVAEFFTRLVSRKYFGLTFIIDEVDALLEEESHRDFALFRKLQGLIDGDFGARLILTGFIRLRQSLYNSLFPLYGRLRTVTLSGLHYSEVEDLVSEPMREVGINIHGTSSVIDNIMFHTGGLPALVQSACARAVERLEAEASRQLTADKIEKILQEYDPIIDFLNWFDFNSTELDKIIVYYAAAVGKLDVSDFRRRCDVSRFDLTRRGSLARILDDLVLANIFRPSLDGSYTFTIEAFRRIVASRENPFKELRLFSTLTSLDRERDGEPKKLIFISYAHSDNEGSDRRVRWLDRLLEHLEPLHVQEELTFWSDRDIEMGERWQDQIEEALQKARAAIVMVSPAFLASRFVRTGELPVLLRRAQDAGVLILPIIVRPCLFLETRFKYPDPELGPDEISLASLQALNSPKRPLSGMTETEQDEIFVEAAKQILALHQAEKS
jgi:hypothetical protein